jgi:hypothetical protein
MESGVKEARFETASCDDVEKAFVSTTSVPHAFITFGLGTGISAYLLIATEQKL